MFTDEKFKQVKEEIERKGDLGAVSMTIPLWKSLLERLEAAEKCVELCSTDECCCCVPEFGPKGKAPDAISWHEIWKKSCGKE